MADGQRHMEAIVLSTLQIGSRVHLENMGSEIRELGFKPRLCCL